MSEAGNGFCFLFLHSRFSSYFNRMKRTAAAHIKHARADTGEREGGSRERARARGRECPLSSKVIEREPARGWRRDVLKSACLLFCRILSAAPLPGG